MAVAVIRSVMPSTESISNPDKAGIRDKKPPPVNPNALSFAPTLQEPDEPMHLSRDLNYRLFLPLFRHDRCHLLEILHLAAVLTGVKLGYQEIIALSGKP